jgi:uncharacterized protein involved in exopolysaccharide biosynthesis/Mrp family chromosome partitioning ATPase
MNDWTFSASLRDVLHLLFSYKRLMVVSFFAVFIPSIILTCAMTPVYETRVKILVESEYRDTSPLGDEAPLERPRQAANEMQILLSTPVILAVIDELELLDSDDGLFARISQHETLTGKVLRGTIRSAFSVVKAAKSLIPEGDGPAMSEAEMAELQRERQRLDLVDVIRGSAVVVPIEESQVFEVIFSCNDRRLARDINNELAHQYIERRVNLSTQAFAGASNVIDERLLETTALIDEQTQELIALKSSSDVYDPATELENLRAEVTNLRASIQESQATIADIRSQLESGDVEQYILGDHENLANPALSRLYVEQGDLQSLLGEYRSKYPSGHRLIVDTEERLAALQVQIEEESPAIAGPAVQQLNPVWTNLNAELGSSQIRLTRDQARLTSVRELILEKEALQSRWNSAKARITTLENSLENLRLYMQNIESQRQVTGLGVQSGGQTSITPTRIIEEASYPLEKARPDLKVNVVLGAILGIILGLSIVAVYAYFDHTVRSSEMAERAFEMPVLATIPDFQDLPLANGSVPLTHEDISHLGLINTYRGVAQRIVNETREQVKSDRPRVILFCSANPGEGVSTVMAQLGAIIAKEQGLRVVLVDAVHDKVRSNGRSLSTLYGEPADNGLLDTDVERVPLDSVLRKTPVSRLKYVASGRVLGEVLPGNLTFNLHTLIDRLRGQADLIFVDTPPIIPSADYLALAPLSAACVMVVRYGQTKREVVGRALTSLRESVRPIGLVLNRRPRVIPDWLYRNL